MRRIGPKLVVIAAVATVTALFFPIERTVAPEWQVTVVDDKGIRLADIDVRETWQDLSTESKPHEELRKTDAAGAVKFPRHVLNISLFRRAWGCWNQQRKIPSPAPCGPSASVWAFGPQLGPMDADDVRETSARFIRPELTPDVMVDQQTSMIMLHHCPTGFSGVGCKTSESYRPVARP